MDNNNVGIYSIRNLVNGKVYIGKSKDLKKRWIWHLSNLKNGNRHNSYLQNSWNKYGEKSFKFEVIKSIDFVDDKILSNLEKKYIKEYNSQDANFGYNMTSGGDGVSNPSEDVRKKISESRMGVKFSDETLTKMSEAAMGRKGFWKRKKRYPETIEKMSKANIGKISPMRGIKKSIESIAKVSASLKIAFANPEVKKRCQILLRGLPLKGGKPEGEIKKCKGKRSNINNG